MDKLFEMFPYAEVFARIIYKYAMRHHILKKRIVPNEKAKNIEKVDIKELDEFLDKMGVKEGDTLIVHSSMSGIKGFGLSAEEILSYLEKRVGPQGYLVLPAYPDYKEMGIVSDYNEIDDTEYEYDVLNTKSWTGYLTEVFRKQNGTIRSCYPNNSLAVRGQNLETVFENELKSDLAYDRNSVWNFCMNNHAKILFLGIHAHHSISEIHIAEDYMDKEWPVEGWYAIRNYKIITEKGVVKKQCRVRKNFWTKYMVEYNGCARLRKEGLLLEGKLGNICVSFVPDIFCLEKYVEECAKKGDLVYFKIPRRYRKKQ